MHLRAPNLFSPNQLICITSEKGTFLKFNLRRKNHSSNISAKLIERKTAAKKINTHSTRNKKNETVVYDKNAGETHEE